MFIVEHAARSNPTGDIWNCAPKAIINMCRACSGRLSRDWYQNQNISTHLDHKNNKDEETEIDPL
ncbi:16130_t:CDS:2 [Entrophospora sp. SA101]|nr:16130_t:CDS:2 [Entrophospora sp. SA101]